MTDLASAYYVYKKAEAASVGTRVRFLAEREGHGSAVDR